ncbi:hypothetical protein J437_LFUL007479 [Ladona fulva]|uniref:Uncharacterized protein n=1 Tax=Ladona fulva TaxID=123851 RepID=A0A8K0KCK9_LADFU|nr:hypothetical protein J437_LFUL007479 [Ladona fulva]
MIDIALLAIVATVSAAPGFLSAPIAYTAPVAYSAPLVAAPLATSYANSHKLSIKAPILATTHVAYSAPVVAASPLFHAAPVAYAAAPLVKTYGYIH